MILSLKVVYSNNNFNLKYDRADPFATNNARKYTACVIANIHI